MTTDNRGFIYGLWDFFCSLKLSISLLIGLAVTSIVGTVLPQGTISPEYLAAIGGQEGARFKFYNALGFFDMYHSWWYILLLYLLTVNLIACSIKRLPRVWKIISEPTLVMDDAFEKSLSLSHDVKMPGAPAVLRDKLNEFLSKEFAKPVITEDKGEFHLFAQKNPWCRLGVYVVHTSIVVIFIGALLGSFFGYKGYIQIPEGMWVDTVYTRSDKPIKLDFGLKLEKFSVTFYDTGAPKEFKSMLTVLENGQPVPGLTNRPTIVNDPLTYKGITFYQSSYGPAEEGGTYYFSVRERKGGVPVKLTVRQGETVQLPGGGTMHVLEATRDVRPFMPQFTGPAARIEVHAPGGKTDAFIVLRNYPNLDEQRGEPLIFTYDGADEKFFTGLQVAKDPGVWVVWIGCTIMVIGICMAFFMSHKRVWVRVGHGRVAIGGTASKNPAAFQGQFDELVDKLKKL